MKYFNHAYLSILLFAVSLCLIGNSGQAQTLGSLYNASEEYQQQRIEKGTTLKRALELLEKEFGVVFLYRTDAIKNKKILRALPLTQDIEPILKELLKGQALRFEYFNAKTYGIFVKKQPHKIQQVEISGTVTDATTDETMPGVNVIIKGTSTGAATNMEGHFELTVHSLHDTLVVSFIGYQTKEVPIRRRTEINVQLQPTAIVTEELVVIGYGTEEKASLTAAVSSVEGENLESAPVSNITNSLTGRLAGVITKQESGEPGFNEANIYIRGISSIGSNEPLVIVDGIRRSFGRLDPNTIKSITVLKDAAAVAPYGVAGANGVILVTTKKGQLNQPLTVTYSGSVGIQNPTVLPNYLSSHQWALLKNAAQKNVGLEPSFTEQELKYLKNGTRPDRYPSYQSPFKNILIHNTPLTRHTLEISGGTKDIAYYGTIGYMYQKGMLPKIYARRYNVSLDISAHITESTELKIGVKGIKNFGHYAANTNISINEHTTDRFFELFQYITPAFGPKVFSNGMYGNYVTAALDAGYSTRRVFSIYSNLSLKQDLSSIIPGLIYYLTIAYDPGFFKRKLWKTPNHLASVVTTGPDSYKIEPGIFGRQQPFLTLRYSNTDQMSYKAKLQYEHAIGRHSNLSLMGVFETIATKYSVATVGRSHYNIEIDEINSGNPSKQFMNTGGTSSNSSSVGLAYRAKYSYKNKYYITASGRLSGHYYFAPDKRFGFFPAVSVAWRLSEEKFLRGVSWLDNLKFRASYGVTGALAGAPFQYLNLFSLVGTSYVLNNAEVQGLVNNQEPNPNITWERAKKIDIGLDISLFDGRFSMTMDYFHGKRTNMLIAPGTEVPVYYGISLSQVNSGAMVNRGFEVSANYNFHASNDFNISIAGNLTYAKNKLLKIYETEATYNNPRRRRTGKPLGTQFGYKAVGYFQVDDFNSNGQLKSEIATQPWGEVHPGDIRYADLNGDGKIDVNDVTAIGHPNLAPGLLYGITPRISYKNLSLSVLVQGAAMRSHYYHPIAIQPFAFGILQGYEYNLDYWTPENTDARMPRLTPSPTTNNSVKSSFWVFDASYIRVKSATLSYTLSQEMSGNLGFKKAMIYLSGQNLMLWTDIINSDPELGQSSAYIGSSGWVYPPQQVFTLGIELTF